MNREMRKAKIQLQLKDIIRNDEAIAHFGLNPYCVNEGADGEEWFTLTMEEAFTFGLLIS